MFRDQLPVGTFPLQTAFRRLARTGGVTMHDQRSIFWPAFWAMLAALVVFSLLRWGLSLALDSGLFAARTPMATVETKQPLEVWFSPSEARRRGESRACDGDRVLEWRDGRWQPVADAPRCAFYVVD